MAQWDENTPLDRAIPFAAKAHAGLTDRTGKEGQICHVLRVEKNAHKLTNDERVWVIALLHDTVEDTPVTLEDIHKEFGEEIADGVKSVTRGFRVRGEDRMVFSPPPAERTCDCEHTRRCANPAHLYEKEKYRHFVQRSKQHPLGRMVKIADLQDNMARIKSLPEDEWGMLETRYEPAMEFLLDKDATEFYTPPQLERKCKFCRKPFSEHTGRDRECLVESGAVKTTFKGVKQ
jgi:(p)ppGpp synthase/HD superfamily hydrolase